MNIISIKNLINLNIKINAINAEINKVKSISVDYLEEEIDKIKSDYESFRFFDKIFKRKDYLNAKARLEEKVPSIQKEIYEREALAKTFPELKQQKVNLQENMKEIAEKANIPNSVIDNISLFSINENGQIVLDLSNIDRVFLNEISENELLDEDKVLVHKTGFYPKDNRILTTFDGKLKDMSSVSNGDFSLCGKRASCRQTVHFTLNHPVNSHAYGNWDDLGIVILDDYAKHEEKLISKEASDAYQRGSFNLSEGNLKVLTRDSFNFLEKGQQQDFNIIILDNVNPEMQGEDISKAVNLVLNACGKPAIFNTKPSIFHSLTCDYKFEAIWESLSLASRFINKDRDVHDKDFTLSGEELHKFAYLTKEFGQDYTYEKSYEFRYGDDSCIKYKDSKGNEVSVNRTLVSSFLYGGIRKNEDGSYSRVNDYEKIIQDVSNLANLYNSNNNKPIEEDEYFNFIKNFIEENDLVSLQKEVDRIEKEIEETPVPTEKEILQTPISELYTFDNIKSLMYISETRFDGKLDYITVCESGLQIGISSPYYKKEQSSENECMYHFVEEGITLQQGLAQIGCVFELNEYLAQ